MSLRLLQLNCTRATAVMRDFGQYICEHSISVAGALGRQWLVQEFACRHEANAAVVMNDMHLDCIFVESLTNESACVSQSRGLWGGVFSFLYSSPTDGLEQYIAYLDEFILRMDVNAVCSMWYRMITQ